MFLALSSLNFRYNMWKLEYTSVKLVTSCFAYDGMAFLMDEWARLGPEPSSFKAEMVLQV